VNDSVNFWTADMRVFRATRVRLRGHLEACGAGDTMNMGRFVAALVEGMWGCSAFVFCKMVYM
jgi:hypothetical protein